MFLTNFGFMIKFLYTELSPKYVIFQNATNPIFDLSEISFLCANFETFTIFSAIVLTDLHISAGLLATCITEAVIFIKELDTLSSLKDYSATFCNNNE